MEQTSQTINVTILYEEEYNFNQLYKKTEKRLSKRGIILSMKKVPTTTIVSSQDGTPAEIAVIQVTISYNEPQIKYGDYQYIATLKKSIDIGEKGTQVFPVKGYEKEDFSEYFKMGNKFRCDHCHTNRRRLKVHLFRDMKKPSRELMIASTCSKEYFGILTYTELNNLFGSRKIIDTFDDFLKEHFSDSAKRKINVFDTKRFAKIAMGVIRQDGKYRSKEQNENYNTYSTTHLLFCNSIYSTDAERIKTINELSNDFDFEDILKYWDTRAEKDKSTFVNNIKVAFRQARPSTGMICYGVYEYLKNVKNLFGNKVTKKQNIKNEFMGNVGDKITVNARVKNVQTIQGKKFFYGDSGQTDIVRFITDTGYVVTWFTKNSGLELDREVKLFGTIKKLNDYNGMKSIIVTRCKVTIGE